MDFVEKKEEPKADETVLIWWAERRGCEALQSIALRLAQLKASSTNIERTFSTLKFIQGSHKPRSITKKLVELVRVKLHNCNKTEEKEVINECHSREVETSWNTPREELLDPVA